MPISLDFDFEELPIVSLKGANMVFADGSATIHATPDGEWEVYAIWLMGSVRVDGKWDHSWQILPEKSPAHRLIHDAILESYASEIEALVARKLFEEGYETPRRPAVNEHSTHYRGIGL